MIKCKILIENHVVKTENKPTLPQSAMHKNLKDGARYFRRKCLVVFFKQNSRSNMIENKVI